MGSKAAEAYAGVTLDPATMVETRLMRKTLERSLAAKDAERERSKMAEDADHRSMAMHMANAVRAQALADAIDEEVTFLALLKREMSR